MFTSKDSKSTEAVLDCMTSVLSDLLSKTTSNNSGDNSSSLKKTCSKSIVLALLLILSSKIQVTLQNSLTFSLRTLKLDRDIEPTKLFVNGSKISQKKENPANKKNTNLKKSPSTLMPTPNKSFIKLLSSIKLELLIQETNYLNLFLSISCSKPKLVHHQIWLDI